MSDADRALALYADMISQRVPMNHSAYSSLITACAQSGMTTHAHVLLKDMVEHGLRPAMPVYTAIIGGLRMREDLPAAIDTLVQMAARGFVCNCSVYSSLLDFCIQHDQWKSADTVLREMAQQSDAHTSAAITSNVERWSKRGELDRAIALFYTALGGSPAVRKACMDGGVASCLLGACVQSGALQRALEIFDDLVAWPGLNPPDARSCEALLCGLVDHGDLRGALRVAESIVAPEGPESLDAAHQPHALCRLLSTLQHKGLVEGAGPLGESLALAKAAMEAR
mmetsp:Transcript_73150/g.202739  ORF Transcript_73150/g.202739 Transcript_73150/m.202739 type:complete len:283 (+) Transcript_73150:2-850(+)